MRVERDYVDVGGRQLHFRRCGNGPQVVLLHDSPRSSRLHLPVMERLARRFTVFALDTPGYGNSDPLGLEAPRIEDFAAALGQALAALGLEAAPIYAAHTSAKIALEYATRATQLPRLILDGLSIPSAPPNRDFIQAYMRPLVPDDGGSYLAAEWTRIRDMLRWFPWFDPRPANRTTRAAPDAQWLSAFVIDLFSAGRHYSDAYAAAMYYDPLPALHRVEVPTIVAARVDDVLFSFLDRVPAADNPCLSIERLGADQEPWLAWLEGHFEQASRAAAPRPVDRCENVSGRFYISMPHGQMHVRRAGPASDTRPLLILAAPTTQAALRWQRALGESRSSIVPDLPGFGESDALPHPTAEGMADALALMLDGLGHPTVDILAIGLAVPLAVTLAQRHEGRVGSLIIDGAPAIDAEAAKRMADGLCPRFSQDRSGSHLHAYWHMLRDGEAQWPWYEDEVSASRIVAGDLIAAALHDALVGVLKQPEHYGDAALAGLAVSSPDLYRGLDLPLLLFEHERDPFYAAAAAIGERLPQARRVTRPAELAEAVAAIEGFR